MNALERMAKDQIRTVIAPAISATGIAVRFRFEVEAPSRASVVEQLAEILRSEGYFVAQAQAWEKVGAYRKRLDLNHEALHRILSHPRRPPVDVARSGASASGRIVAISSNPLFEEFCRANRGPKPRPPKKPRKSRAKPDHLLQRNRMGQGRRKK